MKTSDSNENKTVKSEDLTAWSYHRKHLVYMRKDYEQSATYLAQVELYREHREGPFNTPLETTSGQLLIVFVDLFKISLVFKPCAFGI